MTTNQMTDSTPVTTVTQPRKPVLFVAGGAADGQGAAPPHRQRGARGGQDDHSRRANTHAVDGGDKPDGGRQPVAGRGGDPGSMNFFTLAIH